MTRSALALLALSLATACGEAAERPPPAPAPVVLVPVLGETVQVVPGAGIPAEAASQPSNNNLDVVDHEGRTYLAFRTAPSHFASPLTELHVVSSADELTWEHEVSFQTGKDLREPRFLSFQGRLWLYFTELGDEGGHFEPGRMLVSERGSGGGWSAAEQRGRPGQIPWRLKVREGRALLIGYTGGEHVYDFSGLPLHVHLDASADGELFAPLDPDREFVLEGGGSETDFELAPDGSLWAVVRNEAGDADGFGSKLCTAPAGDRGSWSCTADRRKFDSPLVLRDGDDLWLVGRRNVSPDGAYDLGHDELDLAHQLLEYQVDYWNLPKRCALWRIDRAGRSIVHALDLPSQGDTCFPSALQRGEHTYHLYNYSSPLDGPDLSWHDAQLGETRIYRTVVRFEPSP